MQKRMLLFKRYLIICSLFSYISCYSQVSSPIPQDFIPPKYLEKQINSEYNSYKKQSINAEKYLPPNFNKTGSIDYTSYIQTALNQNRVVLLPDFPILINDRGLTLNDNTVLLFQPNSKLILKPSSNDTYNILTIHNVSNIKVFNAVIEGDSYTHNGKTGEWGMGIAIRSSNNVHIYNPNIRYCWGDGIYIGQVWAKDKNQKTKLNKESSNVNIYNAIVNKNRRNGLSIVAGININVYNSVFAHSYGTFPKSGIDIEPGPGRTDLIKIINTNTYNNSARGIDLMLRKAPKLKNTAVNVEITNYKDFGSSIGLRIAGYKNLKETATYKKILGEIKVSNVELRNNKVAAIDIEKNQSVAPTFTIRNEKIFNRVGTRINLQQVKNYSSIKNK